jgi:tripartite-type tricarboxylate transporter receptor subunit TctC
MTRKLAVAAGCVAALALGAPALAQAQTWPTRTVTIVVPFPPGGGVDVLARIAA